MSGPFDLHHATQHPFTLPTYSPDVEAGFRKRARFGAITPDALYGAGRHPDGSQMSQWEVDQAVTQNRTRFRARDHQRNPLRRMPANRAIPRLMYDQEQRQLTWGQRLRQLLCCRSNRH